MEGPLSSSIALIIIFYILFTYWLHWVFIAAEMAFTPFCTCGDGGFSSLRYKGFWLQRFSRCGAQAVGHRGFSSCGPRAPEHRLRSCGMRAQLFRGIWDLPRPGFEPVSPALAGGVLSPGPPGKSHCLNYAFLIFTEPSWYPSEYLSNKCVSCYFKAFRDDSGNTQVFHTR